MVRRTLWKCTDICSGIVQRAGETVLSAEVMD